MGKRRGDEMRQDGEEKENTSRYRYKVLLIKNDWLKASTVHERTREPSPT